MIAGVLLFLFYYAPTLDVQKIIFETEVPVLLNYVYLIVGIVLAGLAVTCFIFMLKKSFNAWFGMFGIVAAIYAFFLALKIFLGLSDLESPSETSPLMEIALLAIDISILVYAVSTLLGSQAEVLAKQLKYFGIDTIFIWLLFSKASYEFVVNFPYDSLLVISNQGIISSIFAPFLNLVHLLNADLISLAKNVTVLAFFLLLLILLGFWEIRKYNRAERKLKDGDDEIEKIEIPIEKDEIEEKAMENQLDSKESEET